MSWTITSRLGLCALTTVMAALTLTGCGKTETPNAANAQRQAPGKDTLVKLSTFGHAEFCSVAAAPDGTLHALFTDQPDAFKPTYLYYRASHDGGATWSEAVNLSDDESGNAASFCRVLIDRAGRVYAIWKQVGRGELLDGPGGNARGVLTIRCLEGGNWAAAQKLGDKDLPVFSWFAALGPEGKVHLVWSHPQPDADFNGRGMAYYANNVEHAVLDGGSQPTPQTLLAAKPLPTEAEQRAASAAGHSIPYEETHAKQNGLWNLRGYIADDGRPHFIAQHAGPSSQGPLIMLFDGNALTQLYQYSSSSIGNTFNDPPAFVRGGDGKDHLLRKPEQSARDVLRDYPIQGDKPGDPIEALGNAAEGTAISKWEFSQLSDGKIAAMASVTTGVGVDKAMDLDLSIGDGRGHWGKPINVTDNAAREKQAIGNGVSQFTDYEPDFADATSMSDGSIGVIMVNAEHTLTGINAVDAHGNSGLASFSSHNPYVFFTRVKG